MTVPAIGSSIGFQNLSTNKEICSLKFWRDVFIETWIGFIYTFFAFMATAKFNGTSDIFMAGFGIGVYVCGLIETFGHLQWACMNPIVAFAFACTKRLSISKALLYTIAEIGGCTGGGLLAKWCMPEEVQERVVALGPTPGVSDAQTFVVEAFTSMSLMAFVMGSLDTDRRQTFMPSIPIGFTVGVNIMQGANFGAGCMHPALAFAFAVSGNDYSKLWIYWGADYTGTILGMCLYYIAYCERGYLKQNSEDPNKNSSKSEIKQDELQL